MADHNAYEIPVPGRIVVQMGPGWRKRAAELREALPITARVNLNEMQLRKAMLSLAYATLATQWMSSGYGALKNTLVLGRCSARRRPTPQHVLGIGGTQEALELCVDASCLDDSSDAPIQLGQIGADVEPHVSAGSRPEATPGSMLRGLLEHVDCLLQVAGLRPGLRETKTGSQRRSREPIFALLD
jgi:hypothetical protein